MDLQKWFLHNKESCLFLTPSPCSVSCASYNYSIFCSHQNKKKHLDDLYQVVEQLNEVKADKDHVISLIDFKSDKRDLEMKVGRDDFDQYMGIVDQSLRDILQKLDGQVTRGRFSSSGAQFPSGRNCPGAGTLVNAHG